MRRTQFLLLVLGMFAVHAQADPGPRQTIRDQVVGAELVFQGSVERMEYARARQTGQEPSDMHTFVTFHVDRIFKGQDVGGSITLRFLGGIDESGKLLLSSRCPLFDVGERVVLCVAGNEVAKYPLVGWRAGRFRLVGGKVYTDAGRDVLIASAETLEFGAARNLDEVVLHSFAPFGPIVRLGQVPWDHREGDQSQDAGCDPAPGPPAAESGAVSEAVFAQWLASLVARLHTPEDLAALPRVESADPARAFDGPSRQMVSFPSK